LENQVARQVLAPPPRYKGHFASSRPGQDIQADLIDFSKNTSAKIPYRYAVVMADVFTRKLDIEPVKTKTASTVEAAMRRGLKDLGVDGSKAALIRTDQGLRTTLRPIYMCKGMCEIGTALPSWTVESRASSEIWRRK